MYAQCNSAFAHVSAAPRQVSLEETQRQKLENTLLHAFYTKEEDERIHFGLRDDRTPRTAKELVERIKAGEYEITQDDEEGLEFYGSTYGLKWRKPKTKKNYDGYEASKKLLDKELETVKQDVWFLPLDQALASVRSFEAKTFH